MSEDHLQSDPSRNLEIVSYDYRSVDDAFEYFEDRDIGVPRSLSKPGRDFPSNLYGVTLIDDNCNRISGFAEVDMRPDLDSEELTYIYVDKLYRRSGPYASFMVSDELVSLALASLRTNSCYALPNRFSTGLLVRHGFRQTRSGLILYQKSVRAHALPRRTSNAHL